MLNVYGVINIMSQFKLKSNQAALILEVSPEGEVSVEAAFPKEVDGGG